MYKAGWILLGIFYVVAGINHFRDPEFYLPLIPDYFDYPYAINIASGILEILLGVLVLIKPARQYAAVAIILMLLAFIPSHIYFVQQGSCAGALCVPAWVGWVRLVVIHPLLIFWAYQYTKKSG